MPLTDDEIERLANSGLRSAQIAEKAGVSRQAINQRITKMAKAGRPILTHGRGGPRGAPSSVSVADDGVTVSLTGGHVALVSAEDLPVVAHLKWHVHRAAGGKLYAAAKLNGRRVMMHRLLLAAKTGDVADHVDGDGLNNRRDNIRLCTQAENCRNRKGSRAGAKGVRYQSTTGRWGARIRADGVQHWLGYHDTEAEAASAYDAAAKRLHGDFASTNEAY